VVNFRKTNTPMSESSINFSRSKEDLAINTRTYADINDRFAACRRDKKHRDNNRGMPEKRRFIPWDGEGITHPGDTQQSYVLFGCSPDEYIYGHALGTEEILNFISDIGEKYGKSVIHVAFAFNYDVNQIVRDLPVSSLERLVKTKAVRWKNFRLEWMPSKWFRITRHTTDPTFGFKSKVTVTIYDVFTFFATSFVKVCKLYLGQEDISLVEAGKLLRDDFTWDNFQSLVLPYWQREIVLLAKMMEKYRDVLYSVGIYITQWYGPGAVASHKFKKHGIEEFLTRELPPEVLTASAHAYAGGRFELYRCGHYEGRVLGYDRNSAYPYGLTKVRSVAPQHGSWVHRTELDRTQPISPNMAVYHIKYRGKNRFRSKRSFTSMYPLFYRDRAGNISYPVIVEGWYWDPEAALVWDDPDAEILDCWEFEPTEIVYPFGYIEEEFNKRLELKRQKNPAQLGLKLGMNCIYGKLAQRVGWDETHMRPPHYHQLEYAGWVTSYTRAAMYELAVIADDHDALISCETDGIYTTMELDEYCDVGFKLGQWEKVEYEGITYVQNGFYWKKENGEWKAKYRGLDPESVSHDKMMDFFAHVGGTQCPECARIKLYNLPPRQHDKNAHNCMYYAKTRRFIGIGAALQSQGKLDNWRVWKDDDKIFHPGRGEGGKRMHNYDMCPECQNGKTFADGLHPLEITVPATEGMSYPHNLPWVSGKLTNDQETIDLVERYGDVMTGAENEDIH